MVGNGIRVLVAEDNAPTGGMLLEVIPDDYRVDLVSDGQAADLLLRAVSYDVLICDQHLGGGMPGRFPVQSARRLGVFTIGISGEAATEGFESHCDIFMRKPVHVGRLRGMLDTVRAKKEGVIS